MSAEAPWLDAPVVDDKEPWKSAPVVDDKDAPWLSAPVVGDVDSNVIAPEEVPLEQLNSPKVEAGHEMGMLEKIRRSVSPILGPTASQKLEESIPFTDENGNRSLQYKPLGSKLDQGGLFAAPYKIEPIKPAEGDSKLTAAGKALFNTTSGVLQSLESPGGVIGGLSAAVPGLGRALAAGFAADTASHIPEQLDQLSKGKTLQDRLEGGLGVAVSLLTAGAAGTHALAGEGIPVRDVVQRTTDEIRKITPSDAPVDEKFFIDPTTLDNLHLTREALLRDFKQQPTEMQQARQQIIDAIDEQLLHGEKADVQASEQRVATRQEIAKPPELPTTPTEPVAPEAPLEGPPANDGTSGLFKQAQAESVATPAEPATTAPTEAMPEAAKSEAPTENGIYPAPKETVAQQPIVPSPQALGVAHPLPPFLNSIVDTLLGGKVEDQVRGIATRMKGFLGTIKGETFPNTTLADRPSGELAARWISSRIAAPFVADNFAKQVLEGTGVDPVKFGTALTEDNLRSVKQGFLDENKPDEAARVGSTIGGKNSPFKTEAEYQNFLNDPAVQKAIERHQSLWSEIVDPMYKKAMSLDPDTELPSRGAQTGARINLHGIDPSAPVTNRSTVSTVGQGNSMGTLRKKSPFGRQATGTGTYNTDYNQMMANTFGRQLEIANKNAFEDQLVKSGNAVIDKPGANPILPDGEETVGFPLKRQTLVTNNEGGETQVVPQNQTLYVRKTLAKEYRIGSNIDDTSAPGVIRQLGNVLNRAALAGLTDASVHAMNLGTVLFNRPSVVGSTLTDSLLSTFGRADVPATLVKTVVKGFQDNREQLAKLAEIGALRAPHEAASSFNPLARVGQFIEWADKATRLIMDDTFTKLAKEGLVEDTETNRREFINQVGQYNKRGQGDLIRFFRNSGLGPFATAGRNFNVLAAKTLTLSPGAKATSVGSAAILRANMLSKWLGGAVLIGSLNYLLTKDKGGGVMGRPGVKFGYVDTGNTDENGRPKTFNVIDLLGLGRGLRATGVRGAIEAKRNGLTNADAQDSAARDVVNTAISPFVGPVPRFVAGVMNVPTAMGVGKPNAAVAPGESQAASNIKKALLDANPLVASFVDSQKPGATAGDALRRQLPRLTLQPGKPAEMMDKYPQIVRMAQSANFISDTIGEARKMEPVARKQFLNQALDRLKDDSDKKHAIQEFKRRRVWVQ